MELRFAFLQIGRREQDSTAMQRRYIDDNQFEWDAREFRLPRNASKLRGNCCTGLTDAKIEKVSAQNIGRKTPSGRFSDKRI
jgi:hypothetical protein